LERAELISEVIALSRKVNRGLRVDSSESWLRLNLTIPQLKSLLFVVDHGEANFKKLASALKVTPSNLTGVVDRLTDQGLVLRASHPVDRRVVVVRPTDKGQKLVSGLRERKAIQLSRALDGLSCAELKIIVRGLDLLCRRLGAGFNPQ
jgi:DNA-binding MarR family transcriptional regulator